MKTNKTHLVTTIFIFVSLLFLSGCFNVNSKFKTTRDQVLIAYDSKYETEVEFAIGKMTLGLAKKLVSLDEDRDAQMAGDLLSHIRQVQIGVYHPKDSGTRTLKRKLFNEIDHTVKSGNWECMMRNFEKDEISAIYYQEENGQIADLMIIALDSRETAIVQIKGNLARIIEIVALEKSICFSTDEIRNI